MCENVWSSHRDLDPKYRSLLMVASIVRVRGHVGGGGCAGGRRCRPGEFYPAMDGEAAEEEGEDELSR